MTKGEIALKQFCKENSIALLRIPESYDLTPDYKLAIENIVIIAEVKDIEMNDIEKAAQKKLLNSKYEVWGSSKKVGARLRDAISKANRQLKKQTNGKIPSMLVLFDTRPEPFNILTSYEVKVAMFGFETYELTVPINYSPPVVVGRRFGKGKKCTPEHNTSTSAVSILKYDKKINRHFFDVYHNHFSSAQLSSTILNRFTAIKQFALKKNNEDDFGEWEIIINSS